MTEKIRQLENKVRLAGALVELSDIREGDTKNGIPYISFNGVIQCGESQVNRVRFKTFVKSKKSDGTDSKNFATVKAWARSAVSMEQDPNNPTYVELLGSVSDHPYVNREGRLIEATEYNINLFTNFTDYKAEIDIEGFIHSFTDEVKGEEEVATGRQKMRLISRDFFGNMLDFKNIIIPVDLVGPMQDAEYERGCTATFFLSLLPNSKVTPAKGGGIGVQRVSGGTPYLELTLTGAEPVIDSESERALDPKLIKAAMLERKSNLDEILQAGYQGSISSSPKPAEAPVNRNELGGPHKPNVESVADLDEDFPF